jgi:DNA-binding response OmpR family regulator
MRAAEVERLRGVRILLVEDANDVRDVFTMLLTAEGADVVPAGTGREATELARSEDFDLVLTDLGLPDIPGETVIREILATSGRRPRVIAMTGFDEPYISRARQAGADIVLTKPIPWTRLLAHLGADSHAAVAA